MAAAHIETTRRRGLRIALAALVLALVAAAAVAQDLTSIDGIAKVGRGAAPNVRLEVVLQTIIGLEVVRTFTTEEGRFTFSAIHPGDYRVIVKAPLGGRFKDATADLHIDNRSGAQVVSVTLVLDPLEPDRTKAPVGGTISVDEVQADIPKKAKKLYERGTHEAADGHAEAAIQLFRDALQIAPDYLFALNDLGSQLCKVDRLDESISVLRHATEVAPKAYSPHLNLSIALLSSRRTDEAKTEVGLALAIRPDESSALYVSGQVERALGHHAEAIAAFNRALLNSNGRLVAALVQLGTLYEETGDRASAIQSYSTYLDAAPNGPSAKFARSRLDALGAPRP
jgi:tetratricopeptide (TPR) repeat protein